MIERSSSTSSALAPRDARAEADERAQKELSLLRIAAATVGDALLILDANGRVHGFNPAAETLTGWTKSEAIGSFLLDLIPLLDPFGDEPDLDTCYRQGLQLVLDETTTLEHREGETLNVEGTITAVWDEDGDNVSGAVVVLRDVSDRQRLTQRLARASSYDTLTGLLNREGFDLHVQSALESAPAGDSVDGDSVDGSIDVLCHIDLDQFQVVNDTCGHAAGDMLVQWTASLIRERLGDGDVLARIGGDEFGLLIRKTDLERAMALADEIHAALSIFRFIWQEASFQVGMSLGMVPVTRDHASTSELTGAAEKACYLAKQRGRGRTQLYRPDADEVLRHQGQMDWVVRLRQALDEDLFELHWQRIAPIRPVVSDSPLFFEVLLRMRSRDGRCHSPAEFLPAAERFDLMPEIDLWVLRRLLFLLSGQSPDFIEQLGFCTINLSGTSVGRPEVLRNIEQALDESRFPCEKLCFEITETAAVSNLDRALEMIERLRRRKCRWALDDFGSGMSSFRYLQQLPVDFVKIDGNIVTDIRNGPLPKALVKSIHEIAHVIDARTIAEFVEDAELLEVLAEIGIDFVQGYHIGRPQKIRAQESVTEHLELWVDP